MTTITASIPTTEVRRGDVIVDGAGTHWAVRKVAYPMNDMGGVHFTFEGAGTFRYLTNDRVSVAA